MLELRKEVNDNSAKIVKEWTSIEDDVNKNGKYQVVTSFEVFEHFNPSRQLEALSRIQNVLAKNGKLILSVPIECGFPALVKTAIRRINHPHNKHLYNFKNALNSLRYKPMPQYRMGDEYLSHLGFYFEDLEKLMVASHWILKNKFFSPFKGLSPNLNSQVFYEFQYAE